MKRALDSLIGTVIDDKYEIMGLIGAGGFGNVYQARQIQLDRIVALKMMNQAVPENDPNRARFEREAQAISNLKHRNIITFYGFGTWNQAPYMVMELVRGQTLDKVLSGNKPLPPQMSISIIKQTCEALACAHANGVIHRDLKPSNLVLVRMESGETLVKLIDFGLARVLPGFAQESQKLTEAGVAVGSVLYMSPEQCGGKTADERSDIYAVGCILHQCLAGSVPFLSDNSVAVMFQHLHQPPNAVTDTALPEMSQFPRLQEVIFRAMAKNPAERFQTMEEMIAALEAASQPQPDYVFTLPGEGESTSVGNSASTTPAAFLDDRSVPRTPEALRVSANRKSPDEQFLQKLPLPLMLVGLLPILAALAFLIFKQHAPSTKTETDATERSAVLFRRMQDGFRHLEEPEQDSTCIRLGKAAIQAASQDNLLSPNDLLQCYRQLGTLYFHKTEYSKALDSALEGLQVQERLHVPVNQETWMLIDIIERSADEGLQRRRFAAMGMDFIDSHPKPKALGFYINMAKIDQASMHLHLGDPLRAKRLLDETHDFTATERLQQARRLYVLASTNLAIGKADKSVELFRESFALAGEKVLRNRDYQRLALAFLCMDNAKAAEQCLARGKQTPDDGTSDAGLQMLLLATRGDWKQAEAMRKQFKKYADAYLCNYYYLFNHLILNRYAFLAETAGHHELSLEVVADNKKRSRQCEEIN